MSTKLGSRIGYTGRLNCSMHIIETQSLPEKALDRSSANEMVWIPGGTFQMGSDHHYPEEGPAHVATVEGFWIDKYEITNEQFAEFVAATGHVTVASGSNEFRKLLVSNLVLVDPEALDCRNVRWTLLGIVMIGSHLERAAGDPDHFIRGGSIECFFGKRLCLNDMHRAVQPACIADSRAKFRRHESKLLSCRACLACRRECPRRLLPARYAVHVMFAYHRVP